MAMAAEEILLEIFEAVTDGQPEEIRRAFDMVGE
jgi:hypothetical protein